MEQPIDEEARAHLTGEPSKDALTHDLRPPGLFHLNTPAGQQGEKGTMWA